MIRSVLARIFFVLVGMVLFCELGHSQARLVNDTPSTKHPLVLDELPLVGSDSADDRPTFTLDGETMYFGSRRWSRDPWRVENKNEPLFKYDGDIWMRTWRDSGWSAPINIGSPINNSGDQINPTIHPRGDIVYYVGGPWPISFSKLVAGKWQEPRPVPGQINGIYFLKNQSEGRFADSVRRLVLEELRPDSDLKVRAPDAFEVHFREHLLKHLKTQGAVEYFLGRSRGEMAIAPDGKSAIISENFGVDRKYGLGGEGNTDLWITQIGPNGEWGPLNQMIGVNSFFEENYPFIAADGVTLYFTSTRPCPSCPLGRAGNSHIFRTTWDGQKWSTPEAMPAPINSSANDFGFTIAPDGETAYWVSNRSGKGRFYRVKLRPEDSAFAPKPVVIYQGTVTDIITHKPLAAEIFVDNLTDNTPKFSVYSDSISGNYVLATTRGKRLGIQAVALGHLPRSERITIPTVGAFDRTKLDLELAPVAVGSTLELRNVYFTTGQSTLLPESKLELDRVVGAIKDAKRTNLEIRGHTDDVGTPAYNMNLSESRAKAVVEYMVAHGIDHRRLKAVGFGKTKPISKGTDEASRAKNRRVEMVIVSKAD